MSVWLYRGGFSIVQKSGVGRAILHQEESMKRARIPLAKTWREASVVHINTVFPDSACAALLARLQGKKVVYYGHSTQEDFRNSFHGSNVLAPLFRRWISFCYSLGDVVLTPTAYSRGLLQGYGINRPIYDLSNGIDTRFFSPDKARGQAFRCKYGLTDKDKAVISVGHYMERKGIMDFIALAKRLPDVYFFWFGYTDWRLIPRKIRLAIVNAPQNIRFPGYVNREELRDAYCGANAFVFLSYEETEGITVLEALACGVPVIVRDIPVYEGWLKDGRNVYKVSEQKQAADVVSELLGGRCPSLTKNGRQTAAERSLEEIAVQLCRIYRIEELCTRAELPLNGGNDLCPPSSGKR